jgi:S-formylglutathione hydrolase FrmB
MRRSRILTILIALLTCAALTTAIPGISRGATTGSTYPGTAADGARVTGETRVNANTMDITINSPAANATTTVRLLLPPGWSYTTTRTWPVLYLLHGCCDTYSTWDTRTDVTQETAGAPVIIAMPDGGPGGFYTNWWNGGAGGENWETFTASELPQILRSGFHASTKQAIAGVSTGGGAALIIAAHNPGMYTMAVSYSGMVCNLLPSAISLISAVLLRIGINVDNLWGNPVSQYGNWANHDPCSMASKLRGTKVLLTQGSGLTVFGSQTPCPAGLDGNILESTIAPASYTLAPLLFISGVSYTTDFYGGGCHDWNSWNTEFNSTWPKIESALGAG